VEVARVKWGTGRNKARCLALTKAHDIIREAAARAVGRAGRIRPLRVSLPATVELTVYRSDTADDLATRQGVERVNARTVRRVIHSLDQVHRW
jgi:D-aminopeptidase